MGLATAAAGVKAANPEFIRGADVSSLPWTESHGGVYTDRGVRGDALAILKAHGMDWVRLRLFRRPDGRWGCREDLPGMVALAKRAKALGFRVLLDLHESDTWADPGTQRKPEAWQGLAFPELVAAVRDYSTSVLEAFAKARAVPDMVQVGNEVSNGLLWPDGRLSGEGAGGWEKFGALVRAGQEGVLAGTPPGTPMRFLHHVDRAGPAAWHLDHLPKGIRVDCLGVSYYPWWHGSMKDLERELKAIIAKHGVDVVIAETAYPWTDQRLDDAANIFNGDAKRLPDGFPMTPEGQRRFAAALFDLVRRLPGGHGRGVIWWEPTWIALPGPHAYRDGDLRNTDGEGKELPAYGSCVDNVALFGAKGEALPTLDLFR